MREDENMRQKERNDIQIKVVSEYFKMQVVRGRGGGKHWGGRKGMLGRLKRVRR